MMQLYIRVIVACVCVCASLCEHVFDSSDFVDEEEADALCEIGRIVLIQTKLSATQGLLSNGTVGTKLANIDQRVLMMLLPVLLGLWILCAIVWQLRAARETLPQTTSASSAIPGTPESVIDQSTTLQTWQSPTSTRSRDTTIDEVKFHLMTLVVFVHLLQWSLQDRQDLRIGSSTVIKMVRIVHMPAFVMLSGMFSKSLISQMHPGLRQIKLTNTCVNLLGGFLVSTLVVHVMEVNLADLNGKQILGVWESMLSPGPWYVLALFWWRLVWCPTSTVLDPRARLPAALFFAVGCMNNLKGLAMEDTLFFLPFFEIGLRLSGDGLTPFSGSWTACASFLMFFLVLPFLYLQTSAQHWIIKLGTNVRWSSEDGGGVLVDFAIYGVRVCLSVMAIGLLMRIAQIGITTKIGKAIHSMLAGFGRQSLYVYLVHFVFVRPFVAGYDQILNDLPETVSISLVLLLAVVVNILCSTEFTKRMFWWMCEPSYLFSASSLIPADKTTMTVA